MQKPTDRKSIHWFARFINYFENFLSNLSTIFKPLLTLAYKDAFWAWQSKQRVAFTKLKQLVTTAHVLQFYNISKEVTTQCDASSLGSRAVLMQDEQLIVYASKTLTTTERNYANIYKGWLVIMFT